jgi:hypothetical protein
MGRPPVLRPQLRRDSLGCTTTCTPGRRQLDWFRCHVWCSRAAGLRCPASLRQGGGRCSRTKRLSRWCASRAALGFLGVCSLTSAWSSGGVF